MRARNELRGSGLPMCPNPAALTTGAERLLRTNLDELAVGIVFGGPNPDRVVTALSAWGFLMRAEGKYVPARVETHQDTLLALCNGWQEAVEDALGEFNPEGWERDLRRFVKTVESRDGLTDEDAVELMDEAVMLIQDLDEGYLYAWAAGAVGVDSSPLRGLLDMYYQEHIAQDLAGRALAYWGADYVVGVAGSICPRLWAEQFGGTHPLRAGLARTGRLYATLLRYVEEMAEHETCWG